MTFKQWTRIRKEFPALSLRAWCAIHPLERKRLAKLSREEFLVEVVTKMLCGEDAPYLPDNPDIPF